MSARSTRAALLALALATCALAAPARADQVILADGNVVEGTATVDEASGTVTVERGGATSTFPLDQVRRIVRGDAADPAEEAEAEPRVVAVVVPLYGSFELDRSRREFDKMMDEVRARAPRLLLFEVSSPGGLVSLGKHFARRVLDLEGTRTVAFVNGPKGGAFSAAALFALSCDEIFIAPGQAIGAAVPYRPGPKGAPQAVSAKFVSKWKAELRALAERNGHPADVAAAMVGTEDGLAEVELEGKRRYVPARGLEASDGVRIICPPGEVLTLTAEEAARCGLARAVVPDAARVLAGYRVPRARVEILPDPLEVAREAVEREQERLEADVRELAAISKELIERNPSKGTYELEPATGRFKDGGRAWRRRTRECLRNVKRSFAKLEEVTARLEREPDLRADVGWLGRLKRDLEQFEAQLEHYRDVQAPPR